MGSSQVFPDGGLAYPIGRNSILLVLRAQSGDAAALEEFVRVVQNDVFDLALRMLGDATDARDASQEVLVRIVTKLGTFRGDSRFRTWVYRVAANALLDFRGELRRREIPFEQAEEQLQAAVAAGGEAPPGALDRTPVNEVRLVCAHGMRGWGQQSGIRVLRRRSARELPETIQDVQLYATDEISALALSYGQKVQQPSKTRGLA